MEEPKWPVVVCRSLADVLALLPKEEESLELRGPMHELGNVSFEEMQEVFRGILAASPAYYLLSAPRPQDFAALLARRQFKLLLFAATPVPLRGLEAMGGRLRAGAVRDLIFAQMYLGDTGVEKLARALAGSAHLCSLSLCAVGMGDKGALELADSFHNSPTLGLLNLKDAKKSELYPNMISDAGASYLANMLLKTKSLTALVLDENRIGDDGARKLAEALSLNTSLKKLCMKDNPISEMGARRLVEALEHNMSITTFTLSTEDSLRSSIGALCLRNRQPHLVLSLSLAGEASAGLRLQLTCRTIGGTAYELQVPGESTFRELRLNMLRILAPELCASGSPMQFVLPEGKLLTPGIPLWIALLTERVAVSRSYGCGERCAFFCPF